MGDNWQDLRTRRTRRPRRLEEVDSAEGGLPIAWIVVGALAGLIVIGLVGLGVVNIVRRQSITPTPSVIPGLAPTQPIAGSTSLPTTTTTTSEPPISNPNATPTIPPVVTLEPTITPTPTETPVPTAPDSLAPDVYAKIINTDNYGASLRAGPGTNNARLGIAGEGEIVLILQGPRDDENLQDYTWWLVRAPDGTEGWTVEEFLEATIPP